MIVDSEGGDYRMLEQHPLLLEDFRDLKTQSVEDFPAADEFVVELYDRVGAPGSALRFVDSKLGVKVEFPWWDNVDSAIRHWRVDDIPIGTVDEPYSEFDQCWRLVIWQRGDKVCIAAGTDEEEGTYDTWFSVDRESYIAAWRRLLNSL